MEQVYQVRKENLNNLVLNRFRGNKAALARAAGIHPNHVNLVLSPNPEHRRNIGESLSRRIETALGLPVMWLDSSHGVNDASSLVTIGSIPIHVSLGAVLREAPIASIAARMEWLAPIAKAITAVENLFLAAVASVDLDPLLKVGTVVIVDGQAKAYGSEGVYILANEDSVFLRRVKHSVLGDYVVATANEEERIKRLSDVGINVLGKLICSIEAVPVTGT